MPIAGALIGVGGSLLGGLLGGHSANKAADAQVAAANHAADLQHQDEQAALGFNQNVFDTEQHNAAPFLQAGQGAIGNLSDLMKPGGELAQNWTGQFQQPDNITEQNDPGFQARMQMGTDAIQRSAAARGGLVTGGTARDLAQFGQDYASNEYNNVYNRAFNNYQTSYNQFQQNQANKFNRLGAIAGIGQTATGQMNQAGANATGNNSNVLLNSGAQIGQNINNAGAARASGYVGSGNAYAGMIPGLTSNLSSLLALMKGGNGGSGGYQGSPTIQGYS